MLVRKCCVIVVTLIICFFHVYSQSTVVPNPLDRHYFRSPVDYAFTLSGSFCELRETHFHAGIDIKPFTVVGRVPLYSIASGYVSRIKISAGGYGKAIYIDHPEVGYTSVYAHLDDFSDRLEQFIRPHQMAKESYEVDILLHPDALVLEKGEIIGDMGNTGFSFGKHLHFEIRDMKSEKPINPFHFGIKSTDHIPPSLFSLAIHGLDADFYKIWEKRISLINYKNQNIYITNPIEVPVSQAGIALNMIDRSDNSHNKLGIYGLHMYVDDSLAYSYHMDKISFEQARYITGFYDYKVRKRENATYSLCYKYPGNDLEFLNQSGNGVIPVDIGNERKIRVEIEDFDRNRRILHFSLVRSEQVIDTPVLDSTSLRVNVGDSVSVHHGNLSIHFEPKSLFKNINLTLNSTASKEMKYQIHDPYEPIKKPIKISIKPDTIYDRANKAIIVRSNGNAKVNYGGKWSNGRLETEITEFGVYSLDFDTIAPSIKSLTFTPNVGKKSEVRFHVKDNLPTKGKMVDDIKIKVWIDGTFIISPYTSKTQILQIPMKDLANGSHDLKIEVQDHAGNMAYFTSGFVIKR